MNTVGRWASLSLWLIAACGRVSQVADAGTEGGSASDARVVDATGVDAPPADTGPARGCPASLPSEGTACAPVGLDCEYLTDPRPDCRSHAVCTARGWTLPIGTCPPLPSATCPATREAAANQACTTEGAYCHYDGLLCECTNCIRYPVVRCDGPMTWHCQAPNTDTGCPAGMPLAGTPCTGAERQCAYGCESYRARTCRDGFWVATTAPGGCPVSTRSAKRDIRYLSTADVDAIAREAISLPLATWEYRDPALQGRRHLGFILEDMPASYASDLDRRQVDLYGYTSVLAAAVQSQAREIARLRHEVEALRRAQGRPAERAR